MSNVWNAIHLGNPGVMLDPSEGNDLSENASLLVSTTFGSAGDKLSDHVVEITANDLSGNSGVLDTNFFNGMDTVDYNLGAGPTFGFVDATVVYDATITYSDGTTANISAVLFQTNIGELFLAPEVTNNADAAAMEAKEIESLTLNSVIDDNTNLSVNRYDTSFACFASGTLLDTPSGPRRVEALLEGDFVVTLDAGLQRVAWIAGSKVSGVGKAAPIRIRAGALGQGRPFRDLYLSRQHRVLIASESVRRCLGTDEVFLPAFRLAGLPGVEAVDCPSGITYWHVYLSTHHILFAEGAMAESFLPGTVAMNSMSRASRASFRARFPEIAGADACTRPARRIPSPEEQKALVDRLVLQREIQLAQ